MKIGDLLELTKTKKLADIAKEDLTISEKPAREALKLAGCYSISGKRGWYFDGDKSVLEQSIYDYELPSKRKIRSVTSAEKEVSATIEKAKALKNPETQLYNKLLNKESSKPNNKKIKKQVGKPTNKESSKPAMKKVTYEIEEQLHDELRIKSIMEKRTVSEIVNVIIKKGVK
jgi:hypothetical protein